MSLNKIAFVSTDLSVGGAESMLLKLVTRLDRSRFDPVVISLTDIGSIGHAMMKSGIRVLNLGIRRGSVSIRSLFALRKLLRQEKPTLLQGWMSHGNLAGLLIRIAGPGHPALIWGIRQSIYDLGYEERSTARLIRLSARLSGQPQAIVYNSHTARAHHEALGFSSRMGVVIPNGFDATAFAPSAEAGLSVRRELNLADDTRLIGIVGRYHPMKDHKNFIRAAVHVRERHPDCRFVMIGSGMSRANEELSACLREAGVGDVTYLLGSRDDMSRLNAAFDVAVSSSYTESFPNAIGEAMCCGVPCVVTDVGDSALLVGKTGIVTLPRDPEGLASGINQLLSLSDQGRKALGIAARRRVVAEFSLEKVANSYSSLYTSLADNQDVKLRVGRSVS